MASNRRSIVERILGSIFATRPGVNARAVGERTERRGANAPWMAEGPQVVAVYAGLIETDMAQQSMFEDPVRRP